jgi:hypothetical protein
MVSEYCEGCMTDLLRPVSKSSHGLTIRNRSNRIRERGSAK